MNSKSCLLSLLVGITLYFQTSVQAAADGGPELKFNRDIRPILAENCYFCHGSDPASRKAKLRFDREDGFFGERKNGPTVVKGQPDKSPLYQRIMTSDKEEIMPPPDTHKTLKPEEKEKLKRWIQQGAPWEPHWSFIKPERPAMPQVKKEAWVKNPIDRFVLSKLESMNLEPAPEADRRTLARRLSLDLTGLPPEPATVDAFVNDKAPDAYEKYVDQLMASPRYGEHRARYWLDAARYADTHGMHFDNYREMWAYRDWVINAFNVNQPFDAFTKEQIAGDLLPNPTREQLIATGFHRCCMTTNEGGTIPEENLAGYARDRVETTSWVWLGLTANCCVCHDHKFDPLTSKEFYAMTAYFRNTTQGALDGNIKDTAPVLRMLDPNDEKRLNEVGTKIADLKKVVDERKKNMRKEFDTWLDNAKPEDWNGLIAKVGEPALQLSMKEPAGAAVPVKTEPTKAEEPATKKDEKQEKKDKKEKEKQEKKDKKKDEKDSKPAEPATPAPADPKAGETKPAGEPIILAEGQSGGAKYVVKARDAVQFGDCLTGKAPILDAKNRIEVEGPVGEFDKDQSFSYGAWIKTPKDQKGSGAVFSRMDDQANYIGWDLWLQDNEYAAHFVHKWNDDAIKVVTTEKVMKTEQWQHVFVTYNGSGKAEGFKIYVNGKESKLKFEANSLRSTTKTNAPFLIGARKTSSALNNVMVQDIRIYSRELNAGEVMTIALQNKAITLLSKAPKDRVAKDKDDFFNGYSAGDKEVAQNNSEIGKLEAEQRSIKERGPVTHIMEERKNSMPTANVLIRGEYNKLGDKVEPGVFGALHPMPKDAPKNRLGLADWLVSPENPLTPRVTVNRFWQEVFGTGLVKSAEDLGIMGDSPSHPELLDYLAVEFRDTGWDMKKLIRTMVTSATYRQAAQATPIKIEKDPQNRYLSRGPRFRMDAEMIRDYALAACGELSSKIGGPSVKPYQPEGVWEVVGMRESNTKNYKRDTGEALYRRSMYSFWKRMAPPASMEIFNAPNRETACLRRERTNTPLQALATMNDPQFVEAARNLAQKTMKEGGADDKARLNYMTQRILARSFSEKETEIVLGIHANLLTGYKAKPEDAKKLIEVGESKPDATLDVPTLAAWTLMANQLLNLDEALNK